LFRGRDDVYALRWENTRTGKCGYVPATAEGWTKTGPRTYLRLTDEAIVAHLRGRETTGVYPLLDDDTCWFLAFDFDGGTWELDALALLEACDERDVSAALERSRSGEGGHVCIFFSAPVAAGTARRLGAMLLREATARRAELDLASYDRLFPEEDFLPRTGFGNLIALPLQGRCRASGTSVFLDPDTLEPWPDQWAFLASISPLAPERPIAFSQSTTTSRLARRRSRGARRHDETSGFRRRCPAQSALTSRSRTALPPSLLAELKHVASLHNPLFYGRQRLRLSTHKTPRLIRCYEEDITHLHLPRGLLAQVECVVADSGSRIVVEDQRPSPEPLPFVFHGTLTPQQETAVERMLAHESGVLVAPPGAGKTVIACALIAERGLQTLILAHSKPLLEQWRVQLQTLLDLPSTQDRAARRRQAQADRDRRPVDDSEPQRRSTTSKRSSAPTDSWS
jgi:hypothetical protein